MATGRLVQLTSLRGFLPLKWGVPGAERWYAASHVSLGSGVDEEEYPIDTQHRTPTEMVWPASKRQEKFASRVSSALSSALLQDSAAHETLVRQLGLSLKGVRMSPDNLKAFILWDSYTGQVDAAAKELSRCGPRLRAAVARALGTRNAPRLEFRLDRLSARDLRVEETLRRLDEERRQQELLQGEGEEEEQQLEEGSREGAADKSQPA